MHSQKSNYHNQSFTIHLSVDDLEHLNSEAPSVLEILDTRAGGPQFNNSIRENDIGEPLAQCDNCKDDTLVENLIPKASMGRHTNYTLYCTDCTNTENPY